MRVLVTGANGFVGRALVAYLAADSRYTVLGSVRRLDRTTSPLNHVLLVEVGDVGPKTDWADALAGVSIVVHSAGRAHVLRDRAKTPLAAFREVNVDGTINFARQAVQAGVERFIFISSAGVNGNTSLRPFSEGDCPNPLEPYAVSKYEAEQHLWALARDTQMEIVIVRPPLVYGHGAPGNFKRLQRLVRTRIPLPLGAIENRRSFVAVENLTNFIAVCIVHPAAANQVFLVSDGDDVSTPDFLRVVGRAMAKRVRLFSVPVAVLMILGRLTGRSSMVNRLCESLQVDIAKARRLLDWAPPVEMEDALRLAFRRFEARRSK